MSLLSYFHFPLNTHSLTIPNTAGTVLALNR